MDDTIYKPTTKTSQMIASNGRPHTSVENYLQGLSSFFFELACGLKRTIVTYKGINVITSIASSDEPTVEGIQSSYDSAVFQLYKDTTPKVRIIFSEGSGPNRTEVRTVIASRIQLVNMLGQLVTYVCSVFDLIKIDPFLYQNVDSNLIYDAGMLAYFCALSLETPHAIGKRIALMLAMRKTTPLTNVVFCTLHGCLLPKQIDAYYLTNPSSKPIDKESFVSTPGSSDRSKAIVPGIRLMTVQGTTFEFAAVVKSKKGSQRGTIAYDLSSTYVPITGEFEVPTQTT